MAGRTTLEEVLARVKDAGQSFALEGILQRLPTKGAVSLGSVCRALKCDGVNSKSKKEELVTRILLHHWIFLVLPHDDRAMVAQQLQRLNVKGPVSLTALLAEMNLTGNHLAKADIIAKLLSHKPFRAGEIGTLRERYRASLGVELDQLLRSCDLPSLLELGAEIGCGNIEQMKAWRKPKVVQQMISYHPDFVRGLAWVERKLAETVAEVETFRSSNRGKLPKRVHRRKDGGGRRRPVGSKVEEACQPQDASWWQGGSDLGGG